MQALPELVQVLPPQQGCPGRPQARQLPLTQVPLQALPGQQGWPGSPQARQLPFAHSPVQAPPAQQICPGLPQGWQVPLEQKLVVSVQVLFAQHGWPGRPQLEVVA